MKSIIPNLSARFLILIFSVKKTPMNSNIKNLNNKEKQEKKKIVVTDDSMLNYVNEKRLSKSHIVKVKNYRGATSEDILDRRFIESETRLLISACKNQ